MQERVYETSDEAIFGWYGGINYAMCKHFLMVDGARHITDRGTVFPMTPVRDSGRGYLDCCSVADAR